jgi:4-hydroxy-tetrahydrodipicolinate synthase
MLRKLIHGIHAAVLAPRDAQGKLNEAALVRQLEFLLTRGIRKFAFNGATGEYCLTSLEELRRTLQIAKATLPAEASFLCGVGAAGLHNTLALARIGIEAGAEVLLAPMPYFFPYSQNDLAEFVHRLAAELAAPILLYNLPQFTSGLETETVVALLREHDNVVGIKDSSGDLTILRALTQAGMDASRLVGNDGALAQALAEGVCDGVVSGVACVLPEVIQALLTNRPGDDGFQAAAGQLSEFIAKIDALPVPWGLKAIAEARGIAPAIYHQPVSAQRAKQIDEIQSWFNGWIHKVVEA